MNIYHRNVCLSNRVPSMFQQSWFPTSGCHPKLGVFGVSQLFDVQSTLEMLGRCCYTAGHCCGACSNSYSCYLFGLPIILRLGRQERNWSAQGDVRCPWKNKEQSRYIDSRPITLIVHLEILFVVESVSVVVRLVLRHHRRRRGWNLKWKIEERLRVGRIWNVVVVVAMMKY